MQKVALTHHIQRLLDGLPKNGRNLLIKKVLSQNKQNVITICKYSISHRYETNPSDSTVDLEVYMVAKCSVFLKNKNFNDITKEDLLSYLQSLRRDERKDPTHKWVGMHNSHLITLKRFFKWLYYPEIEAKKRQCPIIFNGITKFKRREISGYSPEGMWTAEDTLLFLRYCISARNKCYVAMALDTAWRPSEGLRLRSRDITIEHNSEGKKYAEIFIRTGKTGARSIPLTDSMPWVKEWEQQHPQSCNRESIFLCGFDKSRGKKLTTLALNVIYKHYKKEYFYRKSQFG